jgi:hypothetical protein
LPRSDEHHKVRHLQSGEDGNAQLWTDSRYADEPLEDCFLFAASKPEEHNGVLADMRMDAQFHAAADIGQYGECRDGDQHVIPDSPHVDDDLVWMLLEQRASKVRDHKLLGYLGARQDARVAAINRHGATPFFRF